MLPSACNELLLSEIMYITLLLLCFVRTFEYCLQFAKLPIDIDAIKSTSTFWFNYNHCTICLLAACRCVSHKQYLSGFIVLPEAKKKTLLILKHSYQKFTVKL